MPKMAATLVVLGCLSGCTSGMDDAVEVRDQIAPVPPQGDSGDPATNSPPSLAGTPRTSIRTGENYDFTPQASDPDGDRLTFSINNRPSWANFDTSNGRLTGLPQQGDEGTYSNISISVSDGQLSTSLGQFSVSVSQISLGSATLSWTPPTQNNDGSPLTNLAGFTIYYGVESGDYRDFVRIDNPGITTYVVDNLSPSTYFFVSTAFNSNGVESAFSNEAVKVVN